MPAFSKRSFLSLLLIPILAAALAFTGTPAMAAKRVRIASVGWTGVTVKTDLAVAILQSLGYEADNIMVSVPIAFKAVSTGEADAFMGNWMPSQKSMVTPYLKDGSIIKSATNMSGAQYTLAVPTYCAEGGLRNFADIAKFGDKLDWKIYGIEAGNDGNEIIQNMIDKNMFGLGKFTLVPSSEAGMLAQVQSYVPDRKWIVFLGWAPHSMNERIDMTYLKGSTAETFGADDGTAEVWTVLRPGFEKENPNAARLLHNMTFSITMMNRIMAAMHKNESLTPREAGLQWIKTHPATYRAWLDGVTTIGGKPGVPAFEAVLQKIK